MQGLELAEQPRRTGCTDETGEKDRLRSLIQPHHDHELKGPELAFVSDSSKKDAVA